jgi:selenocysteine lyase/cysteine desulfurase
MLDGAHAIGTRPVNVRELGCDFYTGCGHKWLFAPQGTGFLYVRRDRLSELQHGWVGAGSTKAWQVPDLPFESQDGAKRFEFGTRPRLLHCVLPNALDFNEAIGVENIQAHAQALLAPFKAELRGMRGINLRTPEDPQLSSSLVVFHTTGLTETDITERLWREHRIIVPHNPETHWTRLSVACFTTREELERVLELFRDWQPSA